MMKVMQTNYGGAANVTNAAPPHMRVRRGGTVVVMGSRGAYHTELLVCTTHLV